MKDLPESIAQDLNALPAADQARVREYIAFLNWQAGRSEPGVSQATARPWALNLLEHFAGADVRVVAVLAGMEVEAAETTVGGERRPALWQHPPVSGESAVEFHVPIPVGLRDLRLRFSIGIRDGAQAEDRLVVFVCVWRAGRSGAAPPGPSGGNRS